LANQAIVAGVASLSARKVHALSAVGDEEGNDPAFRSSCSTMQLVQVDSLDSIQATLVMTTKSHTSNLVTPSLGL
jgi:hypothetical protein